MAEHIRIGDIAPRVHYAADGAQTVFVYPFPIFEASDLELRIDGVLQPATAYAVSGAGSSAGGSVTLASPPPAGSRLLLRRVLPVQRVTDFQPNGLLRAATLNEELDRQVAFTQELREEFQGALRAPATDLPASLVLPDKAGRANRVLGFDSLGNATALPRDPVLQAPFGGAIPRSIADKLAERLTARDFGAMGDGVTDDGPALQAAMAAAGASGKFLEIGEGTHRTTIPLVFPGAAAGLVMRGAILYAGPGGETALTIGDGAAVRNQAKYYHGIRVLRASITDWLDERDIGVVLRNLDSCVVELRQVEGFTIGIRTLGVERGVEDSDIYLGRIVNNGIGLDVRTQTAGAWNTSVRYYGGHFAHGQSVNVDRDRFGVRFSAEPGAYVAHNRHVFHGPAFELQSRDKPCTGIPFLMQVNSRAVMVYGMRMEGCDPFVARHTAGAQDHVYEVAWASQGYNVSIDYAATATRVGSVVRALHQAVGHREALRLVGDVPNLRAAAIRWSATETGFEKLAALSTNVSGGPTSLPQFTFAALDNYTLTDSGVLLTGGRGLGFVVDTRRCKEFALAVDGDDPRLVVQCFDASMALLSEPVHGPQVRASGMSMAWAETPRWWQGNADNADATLTRLQTLRVADGVAYAIVGVARLARDYELRSMRLYCDPGFAPPLLYGQPNLPHGRRDLVAEAAWDPPSIPAGGSAQLGVSLPGVHTGDFVQAAFSRPTTGIVFHANVGADGLITVTAWNRHVDAIDLGAGTIRVRAVKA